MSIEMYEDAKHSHSNLYKQIANAVDYIRKKELDEKIKKTSKVYEDAKHSHRNLDKQIANADYIRKKKLDEKIAKASKVYEEILMENIISRKKEIQDLIIERFVHSSKKLIEIRLYDGKWYEFNRLWFAENCNYLDKKTVEEILEKNTEKIYDILECSSFRLKINKKPYYLDVDVKSNSNMYFFFLFVGLEKI